MSLKQFLFSLLILTSFINFAQQPVVIELFTSQGCSSCPPADALLDEVSQEYGDDVIVLSYHVDYWDYIGWKDPFGSKLNTEKQYAFAKAYNLTSVYTPQAIINQQVHFTGSNEHHMKDAIIKHSDRKEKVNVVIDGATRKENKVNLLVEFGSLPYNAQITYAIAVREKATEVKRGENRNKTLINTHIVANFAQRKSAEAKKNLQLELPSWVSINDELDAIVYINVPREGIVGASRSRVQ
ncbi:DUF1223 domain-containing protein [Dokdonia sinensis]|uniref:DUF1223 domain-containing protein n=1 Tax=Dokdonia sinensis TaxID=2479847 RepID=A0A3M0G5U8_9FLAO|nr:DUF1223 domain-containing protein [Dokdonia sinensis]RMB59467.1 DUF1223 domain-containing protein [Dokdonia sinensis]